MLNHTISLPPSLVISNLWSCINDPLYTMPYATRKGAILLRTQVIVFSTHIYDKACLGDSSREHIFYVNRTSYVCDNFQSINCVKYVLGYISRSIQFQRKLWELFCIRSAYGVWIPQHTPSAYTNTWQHLWVWLCTTWETRSHQTWDDYNWPTPPYSTAFFWLVFTQASKEKNTQ